MTLKIRPGLLEQLSSKVTRNLCVGPAPRDTEDIHHILGTLGCNTVINVANEEFFMDRACQTSEEEALHRHGATYIYDPLYDGKAISLVQMRTFIDYANRTLAKKGPYSCIYVHCHAGLSRSPAVLCIILIGFGHDPEEVKRFMERRHPQTLIHPVIWASIVENAEKIKGTTKIEYNHKKRNL